MLSPFILNDIQANILKPHHRNVCCLVFCRWQLGLPFHQYRSWVQEIGRFVTTQQQQQHIRLHHITYKQSQPTADIFVNNLGLTFAAYQLLESNCFPKDFEFKKGMHNRRYLPDYYGLKSTDQTGLFMQEEHHALICLAADAAEALQRLQQKLLGLPISKSVIANCQVEWIHRRRKKPTKRHPKGELRGPFDFKDDVSKPLPKDELTANYNSAFKQQRIPEEPDPHGTYLAAQKIICHINTFEVYARELQAATGYTMSRAKALLIGRFQNGTPLDLYTATKKGIQEKEANDFDYHSNNGHTVPDLQGMRCPLHAHTRSVNPRKDGQLLTAIIRRGLSYHDASSRKQVLMFLSFQASIKHNLRPLYDNMLRGRFNDGHLDALVYQPQQDFVYRKATNSYWVERGDKSVEIKHPRSQQRFTTFTGSSFYYFPSMSYLKAPR